MITLEVFFLPINFWWPSLVKSEVAIEIIFSKTEIQYCPYNVIAQYAGLVIQKTFDVNC